MKQIMYETKGTCSKYIFIEADDNQLIQDIKILGGCSGNLQGICQLLKGMSLNDAKSKLTGIMCGMKPTSCPDQISKAAEELQKQYE